MRLRVVECVERGQHSGVLASWQKFIGQIDVERDDLVWSQEILPKLLEFCTKFHSKITGESER